jgi:hypothetical protein
MRFTVRQLMLLPAVFLLNTWLVGFFAFPAIRTYPWQQETNSVRHAQQLIEDSVRYCKHANITVTDDTINDWIHNRLSSVDPAARILMHPPRPDAWGNPYRIQSRKTFDEKARVYSTGEDGASKTDGNDPDDVRSWDEERWRWYSRRQFTRETAFCMMVSAFITVTGFCLLTLKPKSTSNDAQRRG